MIRMAFIGDPERIPAEILAKAEELRRRSVVSMGRLVLKLSTKIKADKLSGDPLKNRTGTLRRSITAKPVMESGNTITGEVSTNVIYARIHEYGGQTAPHVILPKRGRALAFTMNGRQFVLAKVNHPGSKIPERSFMRSALREMEPEIRAEFSTMIGEVLGR